MDTPMIVKTNNAAEFTDPATGPFPLERGLVFIEDFCLLDTQS